MNNIDTPKGQKQARLEDWLERPHERHGQLALVTLVDPDWWPEIAAAAQAGGHESVSSWLRDLVRRELVHQPAAVVARDRQKMERACEQQGKK